MLKKIPPWLQRVVVIIVIAPLVYFAWEMGQQDHSPLTPGKGAVSAVRVGSPATDFKVPASLVGNQKTFQLSSVKGTPIIFHFWATWCGPCIHELPELIKLAQKTRSEGFTIIAVVFDDDWQTVERFFTRHPKLAPLRDVAVLILDPHGTVTNLYNVSLFPETLLINRDFVVDNKLVGPQPWLSKEIWRYLDRLKKEKGPL